MYKSWSLESSIKWSIDNPSKGQCDVSALVVNDILGGDIQKTKMTDGWHFFNVLNRIRCDFTASQFKEVILYIDISSNRAEAHKDTNKKQYNYLKKSVLRNLEMILFY